MARHTEAHVRERFEEAMETLGLEVFPAHSTLPFKAGTVRLEERDWETFRPYIWRAVLVDTPGGGENTNMFGELYRTSAEMLSFLQGMRRAVWVLKEQGRLKEDV